SDSRTLEEPKDPGNDNTFKLFALTATPERTTAMRENYLRGGYGYGHAKKELLDVLITAFAKERTLFHDLMNDRGELDRLLRIGAEKAREVADRTLARVRERAGYGRSA
ncbi:MAG TPA: tryptophan--tRNA ligase, partial [Flavobacteriales bacterium]|nr:tryptophan--tRNA ligase [Flavobacteriales bacterium]